MKLQAIFTLLLFLLLTSLLSGQQPLYNHFEQHYLFQERLARGLVFEIIQDHQGFMWFATEYGLFRYDGSELKAFKHDPANPHSLAGNVITCIAEDTTGNLWVGTQNSGVHYFDQQTGKFYRYQYEMGHSGSLSGNSIEDILITHNQEVWVSTKNQGVHLFDPTQKKFRQLPEATEPLPGGCPMLEDANKRIWLDRNGSLSYWAPTEKKFLPKTSITVTDDKTENLSTLESDASGSLWLGYRKNGLQVLRSGSDQLQSPPVYPQWPDDKGIDHIWDILAESEQQLFVATDAGLFHLKQQSDSLHYHLSQYTLTSNLRYLSLCKSRDNVLWIGTNNGVLVLAPKHKQFKYFTFYENGVPLKSRRGVSSISQSHSGQIWVGSGRGLFQFDPTSERLHQDFLKQYPELSPISQSPNMTALFEDSRQNLWLATIGGFNQGFGLFCFRTAERKLIDFSRKNPQFKEAAVFSIREDPNAHIWLASEKGLFRYLPKADSIQLIKPPNQSVSEWDKQRVNQITVSDQRLWLATNHAGVVDYQPQKPEWLSYPNYFERSENIAKKRIIDLVQRQQQLWMGTAGGLVKFDLEIAAFSAFDSRHGLEDNVIKGLCFDQNRQLWIASQTHLATFNEGEERFVNFDLNDGVKVREFWDRAVLRDDQGQLYFGGNEGLLVFHPDSIQLNQHEPKVVFTKFLLFTDEILPDSEGKIISAPIHLAPAITLRYDQNIFSLHFASLSFINPKKSQYAIMMEGFEEKWQLIGNRREATYTNLSPGKYRFLVKAANNDGRWQTSPAFLQITILPPWYSTLWAYLVYIAIISGAIYMLYLFQIKRRLVQIETQQLREINRIKTELYTNITHEFRTPLTLIQGPVERALEDDSFKLTRKELTRIRQHCMRLLKLIGQILSLRKLEANALQPNYQYGDIIPVLRYLVDAFESLAQSNQIKLNLKVEEPSCSMDFDQEKLFDIMSNLLSNAIKFTPPKGSIGVEISKTSESHLAISVKDTGPGIPESEKERVFDQFYQVKHTGSHHVGASSGIGLALTKRLIEMMGGQIHLESEQGKGSTFSFYLPIKKDHKHQSTDVQLPNIALPFIANKSTGVLEKFDLEHPEVPSILIVEDNTEVASYIGECLPEHFQYAVAANGVEGLEKAVKLIPDLIISDVMMPEMDGYTLLEVLRKDQRTSHIPVILLTARADLDSKLTGLGKGADAYLAKPFNRQELLIRIENLLQSRQRLQLYHLQQNGLLKPQTNDKAPVRQEALFLGKVRKLIEENIEQQSYQVEALAEDLHMSSSQLYRKIKALTGQSPSKFFRDIQLAKATSLLASSTLNVSEIAFQCGFNDPAYFSRVFTTCLGSSPTAFRKDQQDLHE